MILSEARELFVENLKSLYGQGESMAITDLVLEKITGINKDQRISKHQTALSHSQAEVLKKYLERLLLHEPVQYVLNEAWFCGLKFFVDENVLIPRPETEELVEWIIAGCKFPVDELSILDIGTGSGCIPISLKRRIRKARVTAIDISRPALRVAQKNAIELGAEVSFHEMDFLDRNKTASLGKFDLVISNPPYIPEKDRSTLATHVAEFEPASALFVPQEDPLIFYQALAEFGKEHLQQNGKIYAEMHEDHYKGVEKVFNDRNYRTELKKDMQGKWRLIKAY